MYDFFCHGYCGPASLVRIILWKHHDSSIQHALIGRRCGDLLGRLCHLQSATASRFFASPNLILTSIKVRSAGHSSAFGDHVFAVVDFLLSPRARIRCVGRGRTSKRDSRRQIDEKYDEKRQRYRVSRERHGFFFKFCDGVVILNLKRRVILKYSAR